MPGSKSEIYLHIVWATHRRMPMISSDLEAPLYAAIQRECVRLGAEVVAIGGMPDHVHMAVRMPTKLAPARLMQQVKGVSSMVAGRRLGTRAVFRWQEGYGAFSFSRSHRERVETYIRNQKRHHARGDLWSPWETAVTASTKSASA